MEKNLEEKLIEINIKLESRMRKMLSLKNEQWSFFPPNSFSSPCLFFHYVSVDVLFGLFVGSSEMSHLYLTSYPNENSYPCSLCYHIFMYMETK